MRRMDSGDKHMCVISGIEKKALNLNLELGSLLLISFYATM